MNIELLYFGDCPNHQTAERLIREVLDEAGLRAEIVRVAVEDDATASALRFPGSPTIRVNGEDVTAPPAGAACGRHCRIYHTPTGLAGAPSKGAIRAAILRGRA